jgi:hypothetical protein
MTSELSAMRDTQRIEHNLLVLMQVNFRSILNKSLDFLNLHIIPMLYV